MTIRSLVRLKLRKHPASLDGDEFVALSVIQSLVSLTCLCYQLVFWLNQLIRSDSSSVRVHRIALSSQFIYRIVSTSQYTTWLNEVVYFLKCKFPLGPSASLISVPRLCICYSTSWTLVNSRAVGSPGSGRVHNP